MALLLLGALLVLAVALAHAWDVLIVRPAQWNRPLPGRRVTWAPLHEDASTLPPWSSQSDMDIDARLSGDYRRAVHAEREARVRAAQKPAARVLRKVG